MFEMISVAPNTIVIAAIQGTLHILITWKEVGLPKNTTEETKMNDFRIANYNGDSRNPVNNGYPYNKKARGFGVITYKTAETLDDA